MSSAYSRGFSYVLFLFVLQFHEVIFLKNSWFVIFRKFPRNCLLKSSIRCSAVLWISASVYVTPFSVWNNKCTEVQCQKLITTTQNYVSGIAVVSLLISLKQIEYPLLMFVSLSLNRLIFIYENLMFIVKAIWFFCTYLL